MKKLQLLKRLLLLASIFLAIAPAIAQEDAEDEKVEEPEKVVQLKYFNRANQLQFLQLKSETKTGKKTEPRSNVALRVYLDSISDATLLSKVNTGRFSKAIVTIPPAMKDAWDLSATHEFIVVEEPSGKDEEELNYSLEIRKAKLEIDTSSDGETRSIKVIASKMADGEWVPAPEVEMKIGVQRFGGILTGGDDETYTTDSSGEVSIDFTRAELPGDEKGMIRLVARVDDNEELGNLLVEMPAAWGIPTTVDQDFFSQRTLWAKSSRAPYWLMFLAYGIILGVWGTLVYLLIQLYKTIRMGKAAP